MRYDMIADDVGARLMGHALYKAGKESKMMSAVRVRCRESPFILLRQASLAAEAAYGRFIYAIHRIYDWRQIFL